MRPRARIRWGRGVVERNRRTAWGTDNEASSWLKLGFERGQDLVRRYGPHGFIGLGASLIGSFGVRTSQHLHRFPVRTVARRIGRAENGDARFIKRGGQMHRTAVHSDNCNRPPRGIDQTTESAAVPI